MRSFTKNILKWLRMDPSEFATEASLHTLKNVIEQGNMNDAKLLNSNNLLHKHEIIHNIQRAEFKVFSQWGDDGIIQFLVNYLDIASKTFIEFGVENYLESNTRFLLMNNNWRGLIMDGSEVNMNFVQSSELYWKYNLTAKAAFINAENINELITANGFSGDIGLLNIDIDGNDYWVWNAMVGVNPEMIVVEYNSLFGARNPWTVIYDPGFVRSEAHYSFLLYGASLTSLCDLANKKGYAFIGCNSNGNNAYFIRRDKMKDLRELKPEEGYVLSQFSESRDPSGKLSFIRGTERLNLLKGVAVFNTRTGQTETINAIE